ncbi:Ribbon-helix-helix protein, CopG family [Marvinbryantia formatexigens DSM 14469]|uniref:Ribbon-helix-helix protein, CopG family n=1 Tax=Marvinbryantia formatexigens DSM 14469 TaxID=478749 RepID=C6LG83_9FIRM|nr:ribbon-helix-helix domain-containing protein [Marvinbryantia formatexigens]EET60447.1 Ribbon-helix-helix protein, CopG family [Marvinbryantia formatexigens DSM 14469]UWO25216.1 ribbon-helix-helix domain-containing protein [Marvinbryantia formatexigens DSM 14469]SDH05700.1 Ribbon-helix-helix protein, copG family [Marvinbryantia formatexigens]
MSPRTGRPKVENPINIRTSVRLDKETDDKLNEYCLKKGITKGEAIRKGVHLLLEDESKK